MKTIMMFVPAIYLLIAVSQDASAGIADFFSWFRGECNSETGAIYYVYEGIAFNSYPDLKKD